MRTGIRMIIAVLTAAVTAAGNVPAAAVQAEAVVEAKPVCPDFRPLSADCVMVYGIADEPLSVKLVQHSPERKDLVLYDSVFPAGEANIYLLRAEYGDYTIYIGMNAVKGGAAQRIYRQDFTIENADYSSGSEAFSATEQRFAAVMKPAAADDPAEPERTAKQPKTQDGIRMIENTVTFGRYANQRGDYDGDGALTVSDAQLTLNAYVQALAGGEAAENAPDYAQKAACDLDGDGVLSASDAQCLLVEYTAGLAAGRPADAPEK